MQSVKTTDIGFQNAISNIGIAIQGPLVSRGRTGATAHISRHLLQPEHVVDYDCIDNIARLFADFKGFAKIVCVIWSDEPREAVEALEKRIGAQNILTIEDTTKFLRPKKGMVPGNNKYRQFLSSLAGIEALEKAGCKYAIKIRSDQYLDLYQLARDMMKISAIRDKFMMVSRLHTGSSPDHLADFYIGAETGVLKKCFETYLGAKELYRNVHRDIFYSWASVMLGPSPYPPRILGLKTNMRYVVRAWNALYCPASRAVFEQTTWRGGTCQFAPNKTKFLEDIAPELRVDRRLLTSR